MCQKDVWESGDTAPLSLTSVIDKVSGQLRAPATLLTGKKPVPIEQGVRWAPDSVFAP